MLAPVGIPLPGRASELPEKEIARQQVRLLLRQIQQAGTQIAEHVVQLPAVLRDLIRKPDQRRHGPGQDLRAPGHEQGHAVLPEGTLQLGPVALEAPNRHGNLPPAAALLPDQLQDPGRGGLALLLRALGQQQADGGQIPGPGLSLVAQHLLGEKAQGRRLPLPGLHLPDLDRDPQRLGPGQEQMGRTPGQGEDLLRAVKSVRRQADRHLHAPFQQRLQDPKLLEGKVDKAVHIDVGVPVKAAAADLPGQDAQPVCGIQMAPGRHRVVGRGDQAQILQLVPQRAGALPGRFGQRLRLHAGAFQLIQGPEQQHLQFSPAAGAGIDLQPGSHGVQSQRHAQEPSALVQQLIRPAAQLLLEPPGQAREAEDLGIEAQSVAAAGAELPLGLMAVLFGHQQEPSAPALVHSPADLIHDICGFSRARWSQEQCQHSPLSLLTRFSLL